MKIKMITIPQELLEREMALQAMLQDALEEISTHSEASTTSCQSIAQDTLSAFHVEQGQIEKLRMRLEFQINKQS